MTPETLLASAKALIEADPAAHGLLDRCDLIGPTFVDGGAGGDSVTIGTLATDIPCLREPAGATEQIVIGGETFLATDRLFLIKQEETEAITPRYTIKVYPSDGTTARFFEKPMMIDETLSPLVTLKAILVKQGYQA